VGNRPSEGTWARRFAGESKRRQSHRPSSDRVGSLRRENRSPGPDLSRKQSGRREVPGVQVLFPPLFVMEAESREARAWPLPRACPPWAWCATHPASAPVGFEFVNHRVGGSYWLAARVRKTRSFATLGVRFPPDPPLRLGSRAVLLDVPCLVRRPFGAAHALRVEPLLAARWAPSARLEGVPHVEAAALPAVVARRPPSATRATNSALTEARGDVLVELRRLLAHRALVIA